MPKQKCPCCSLLCERLDLHCQFSPSCSEFVAGSPARRCAIEVVQAETLHPQQDVPDDLSTPPFPDEGAGGTFTVASSVHPDQVLEISAEMPRRNGQ
jgi:hypothetical protein